MGNIELRYVTRDEANSAVRRWHRHHKPVRSHYLASGAFIGGQLVGVVIGGRPNAPALCNGKTIEVTRLATDGAHEHVASRLLGAMWRAAAALGFTRAVSYTRVDEPGTCYRAAGWVRTATVKGREWGEANKPGRWLTLDGASLFEPTTETIDRVRWEIGPGRATAIKLLEGVVRD